MFPEKKNKKLNPLDIANKLAGIASKGAKGKELDLDESEKSLPEKKQKKSKPLKK